MGAITTYPDLDGPVITEYPVGAVISFAGATAPGGWLMCDGTAVSRATYAALFAVIGTQYGVGDGSTTFNLPNMKGRVPVGRDGADTDWDVLGETRGAKTHTLAAGEVPNHGHTLVNAGSHNHAYSNAWTNAPGDGPSDINRYHVAVGIPNDRGLGTAGNGDHGHTVNATTGGGGAHNNIQPSIVLNYIIRATPQVVVATPPLWQPGSATPGLPYTCTSTTRPALPFVGMVIFETDTGRLLTWNGTAWDLPRNVAAGGLAFAGSPTGEAALALSKAAAEQVMLTTPPIQTFANRRYKIEGYVSASGGGAWVWMDCRIRRGTTTAGLSLVRNYTSRIGWQQLKVKAYDIPGAQAAQQWCYTVGLDSSVADLFQPSEITVEDVGAA